jgi:hypothetical protein
MGTTGTGYSGLRHRLAHDHHWGRRHAVHDACPATVQAHQREFSPRVNAYYEWWASHSNMFEPLQASHSNMFEPLHASAWRSGGESPGPSTCLRGRGALTSLVAGWQELVKSRVLAGASGKMLGMLVKALPHAPTRPLPVYG